MQQRKRGPLPRGGADEWLSPRHCSGARKQAIAKRPAAVPRECAERRSEGIGGREDTPFGAAAMEVRPSGCATGASGWEPVRARCGMPKGLAWAAERRLVYMLAW